MDSALSSVIKKFYTDSIFVLSIIEIVNIIAFGIVLSLHKYFQDRWVIFSVIAAFIEATIIFAIFYSHILCSMSRKYGVEDTEHNNL